MVRRRRRHSTRPAGPRLRARYLLMAGAGGVLLLFLFLALQARASKPAVEPVLVSAGRTAAIVDQVALTAPDPAFTEQALAYLTAAGFDVDVYEGEDITVEFFRTLPTRGYRLILFRTHSVHRGATRPEPLHVPAAHPPDHGRPGTVRRGCAGLVHRWP